MERLAEAQVNEAKAIKAASEATAKAVADLALKFSFH
jgi:hypothetical protein